MEKFDPVEFVDVPEGSPVPDPPPPDLDAEFWQYIQNYVKLASDHALSGESHIIQCLSAERPEEVEQWQLIFETDTGSLLYNSSETGETPEWVSLSSGEETGGGGSAVAVTETEPDFEEYLLWINTETFPGKIFYSDGSQWISVDPADQFAFEADPIDNGVPVSGSVEGFNEDEYRLEGVGTVEFTMNYFSDDFEVVVSASSFERSFGGSGMSSSGPFRVSLPDRGIYRVTVQSAAPNPGTALDYELVMDGNHYSHQGQEILVQEARPETPFSCKLWIDLSDGGRAKYHDGFDWVPLRTSGSLEPPPGDSVLENNSPVSSVASGDFGADTYSFYGSGSPSFEFTSHNVAWTFTVYSEDFSFSQTHDSSGLPDNDPRVVTLPQEQEYYLDIQPQNQPGLDLDYTFVMSGLVPREI